MQSKFSSCIVSVCNRSCNRIADSLATHGAYVLEAGSCVYMSDVPFYVMDIVSHHCLMLVLHIKINK